jgi:hypothetical protein
MRLGLGLGLAASRATASAPVELAPAFNGGGWTFGTGWSAIDATSAQGSSVPSNSLMVITGLSSVDNATYKIVYTVSGLTAGSVSGRAGFQSGTARPTNGTYTDTITPTGGASSIGFIGRAAGFTGVISNVSIKRTS